MKAVKELVSKAFGHIGGAPYNALCYAVYVARSYQPKEPSMSLICSDVSRLLDKKSSNISKDLSRAVIYIWENGDKGVLYDVYGHSLAEKPSPREMVFAFAQYLWIKDQNSDDTECS